LRIEFDNAKNVANIAKHGVDMGNAIDFDFETAKTSPDTRQNYGEDRIIALGSIAHRLHVLVFTMRGQTLRVISLRKATPGKGRHTMAKKKKPKHVSQTDWDVVDSPPLSDDILTSMKPAHQTFPELAADSARRKRGQRGPQKKPRKVLISLRVERSTVAAYKASGPGYQTRMAAVLEKHVK
jgi:hypothetical protein